MSISDDLAIGIISRPPLMGCDAHFADDSLNPCAGNPSRESIKIGTETGSMFNMDIMRAGAEAFGKIATSIEQIRDVAYAFALREQLECIYPNCGRTAGHNPPHVDRAGKEIDDRSG